MVSATASSSRIPPSFRLGSGATVSTEVSFPVVEVDRPNLRGEHRLVSQVEGDSPNPDDPSPRRGRGLFRGRIVYFLLLITSVGILSILTLMHPGGSNNDKHDPAKQAPSWGPDQESTRSFRSYVTDVGFFCIYNKELDQAQITVALIKRLTGAAREASRAIGYNEITNGGTINGIHHDPVSYLLNGLEMRFGQLHDEQRLAAMVEFKNFKKHPGEPINCLISRLEVARSRAALDGGYHESVEGCAMTLLGQHCCAVNAQQLITFLQPFGGRLPNTEEELLALLSQMKRIGHILEHAPNNLATVSSGSGGRQAGRGAYIASTSAGGDSTSWNPGIDTSSQVFTSWGNAGAPAPSHPQISSNNLSLGSSTDGYPTAPPMRALMANHNDNADESSVTSSDATGTDTDTSSDDGQ